LCVRLKALIAVLLAIGVLASTHVLYWNRYVLERDFKNVELMMEYSDIVNISSLTGKSEREVLEVLKEIGLTTVLFKEMTIDDVERYEAVTVYSKSELLMKSKVNDLHEDWKNMVYSDFFNADDVVYRDCTYFISLMIKKFLSDCSITCALKHLVQKHLLFQICMS